MNKFAPIVLFVYNRLSHVKLTINLLKKCPESKDSLLYIFSDGPKTKDSEKNIKAVRNIIKNVKGFKKVIVINSNINKGLSQSIIDGVTKVINKHGKIIVLEDDILVSKHFLGYMNNALNIYEKNEDVASIHAYSPNIKNLPETFFLRGADCWGWATWKNRWSHFEKNGEKLFNDLKNKQLLYDFNLNNSYGYSFMLKAQINGFNDSWAIRWHASMFLKNKYTLHPGKTLINNIGQNNEGTHTNFEKSKLQNLNHRVTIYEKNIEEKKEITKKYENYYKQKLFYYRLMIFYYYRLIKGIFK